MARSPAPWLAALLVAGASLSGASAEAESFNPLLGTWRAAAIGTAVPGFERLAFTLDRIDSPSIRRGGVAVRRYEVEGSRVRVVTWGSDAFSFEVKRSGLIGLAAGPTVRPDSQAKLARTGGGNLRRCFHRDVGASTDFRFSGGVRF